LGEVILESNVGHDRRTDVMLVPCGNRHADGPLDIEIAPSVSSGKGWRNDPGLVGECGDAGWRLNSKKSADDIISILFIGADKPLFDSEEWPIAESRRGLDQGPLQKRGNVDQNLICFVGMSSSPLPPMKFDICAPLPNCCQD
jgi:hypothetical protein